MEGVEEQGSALAELAVRTGMGRMQGWDESPSRVLKSCWN